MTPREMNRDEDSGTGNFAPEDLPPVPDEDGPRDVPDETVIEKTLPTVPVRSGI